MRIKAIRLKHFMNHVDSYIDISKGFTCIVGPNDNGKSVIIYAIKWFLTNEPKGDSIIFTVNGKMASECSVALILEDDSVAIKERSAKGTTQFMLPKTKQIFYKSDLPKEISDMLNIKDISFGGTSFDLNFSFQLDNPFLISEPASVAAAMIAKFSGTEAATLVAKDLETLNWNYRRDVTSFEEELKTLTSKENKYATLQSIEESHTAVVQLQESITKQRNKLMVLRSLHASFQDTSIKINGLNAKLALLTNSLHNDYTAIADKYTKAVQLDDLYFEYTELDKVIVKAETINNVLSLNAIKTKIKKVDTKLMSYAIHSMLLATYNNILDYIKNNKLVEKSKLLKTVVIPTDLSSRNTAIISMKTILHKFTKANNNIAILKPLIKHKSAIDIKKYETALTLVKLHNSFNDCSCTIMNGEVYLQELNAVHDSNSAELNELWESVGHVCPLCNTLLNGENHGKENCNCTGS